MANVVIEHSKKPGRLVLLNGLCTGTSVYEPSERDIKNAADKGWRKPENEYSLMINANDQGEVKVRFDHKQFKVSELEPFKDCGVVLTVDLDFGVSKEGNKPWTKYTLAALPRVVYDANGNPPQR